MIALFYPSGLISHTCEWGATAKCCRVSLCAMQRSALGNSSQRYCIVSLSIPYSKKNQVDFLLCVSKHMRPRSKGQRCVCGVALRVYKMGASFYTGGERLSRCCLPLLFVRFLFLFFIIIVGINQESYMEEKQRRDKMRARVEESAFYFYFLKSPISKHFSFRFRAHGFIQCICFHLSSDCPKSGVCTVVYFSFFIFICRKRGVVAVTLHY